MHRTTTWRETAFVASICAAAIHFGAAPEHLEEWPAAGVFMIASGAFQLVWGLAVALKVKPTPRLITAGALANAAMVATWAMSRTVGLPLGPEGPWMREHVHTTDLIATALEVLIVAAILKPRTANLRAAAAGALLTATLSAHVDGSDRLIALAAITLAVALRQTLHHRRLVAHALWRIDEEVALAPLAPARVRVARAPLGAR
jgi:hypothetical protein